jgi:DNA-directed RNA polymerase subunit RPC12/RpoP
MKIVDYKTKKVIYNINKDKVKDIGACIIEINKKFYEMVFQKNNNIYVNEVKRPILQDEVFEEDKIMCPFCGYKFEDSWEFDNDEGTIVCERCDAEFGYSRIINITYNTELLKNGNICKIS